MDLLILPIQGADVVLGIHWLELLGPIITNYKLLTMDFQWNGKIVYLIGEPKVNDGFLAGKQFLKLSKSWSIVSLYHLKAILLDSPNKTILVSVQPLLQQYAIIFETPTTLPPFWESDHQIHLKPNAALVNVRPYRYPQFQKTEMEKLIQEMLQQGIIRASQSPFSSAVLLFK